MQEQKSTVEYNGLTYEVFLDKKGIVWFVDPRENIKKETILGETENIQTIEDAKAAVLVMLRSSAESDDYD